MDIFKNCFFFFHLNRWTVRDVEVSDLTNSHIKYTVHDLKPFTQYALYIRTYTTASGRQGAQSNILYFKTKPDSK